MEIIDLLATLNPMTAVLTIALYLIYTNGEKCVDYWINKHGKVSTGLNKINDIYDALNSIQSKTGASACRLMSITNSGAIPRPGITLYASTVYEIYDEPNCTSKAIWSKTWMDQWLHSYACQLLNLHEPLLINRKDLKEGSVLRDALTVCNSDIVLLLDIGQGIDVYRYLQIEFPDTYVETVETRNAIRTAVNIIRNSLK